MRHMDRRQFLRTSILATGALLAGRGAMGRAGAAEGTITLYNGQHATTTDALVDAFTAATGIGVDIRAGSSGQLANQLIEEGDASPADVFFSEESPPVAALAEKGLLSRLDDATLAQVPARYAAADGTWIGASARCRVVAYNKAMVGEREFPPSVLDFASPAWQDRIAYVPTSGAFLAQIVAIEQMKGREAALDWLEGLKRYGRAYNSNNAAMKAVEAGEIAAALVNNYYWFSLAAEVGDINMRSALHYIGDKDPGGLVTVSAAAVLKSSGRQAAAQRFVAFMVSADGQQAIVDTVAEYPVRPGIVSPFRLKPLADLDPPPVTPADLGDARDALILEREAGLA